MFLEFNIFYACCVLILQLVHSLTGYVNQELKKCCCKSWVNTVTISFITYPNYAAKEKILSDLRGVSHQDNGRCIRCSLVGGYSGMEFFRDWRLSPQVPAGEMAIE